MALLNSYKKTEVKIEKENKIVSIFDYSDFSKNERELLEELEQKATHYGSIISDSIQELGDVFKKAQECFANYKNGSFVSWYEKLGYKKDFVYLCLDRKNLALKYDNKDIYRLPDRAIKDIKRLDNKDETEIVFDILMDPEPTKKIKEIKESAKERKEKQLKKELEDDKIEEAVVIEKPTQENEKKEFEDLIEVDVISKISFIKNTLIQEKLDKDKKNKVIKMLQEIENLLKTK